MNIIIAGCGKVGAKLIEQLSREEEHDITIIDTDAGIVQELVNEYDVMGIVGSGVDVDVLKDAPETVFNDIIYTGSDFIIVGESATNEIYSNGVVVINQRQGYLEGIILKVSKDGTVIKNAYMAGSNVDDRFIAIKKISNDEYVAIGRMSDDVANMTYRINPTTFELYSDITSSSSDYVINGIVSWTYGYAYYGTIKAFRHSSAVE